MYKTTNILGATGLVGRELVNQLLGIPDVVKVRVFVRRDMGISHPKLEQLVVDFDRPETWKPFLEGDILFSTMGTTLKQAGSKENQYKVDYTYQYRFAEAASGKGIPVYVLVSSAGASPHSKIFYSRIKGELDEAVQKLGFRQVVILRPSILAGTREKKRPFEEWAIVITGWFTRFLFRKYRPVPASTVAKAMIRAALGEVVTDNSVVNPEEVFKLAGE